MNENRCVVCGEIVPEGRMVCPKCDTTNVTEYERVKVKLNTFEDVTEFVRLSTVCIGEVLAYGKHHMVSAKSIMGMYSLDLTNQIEVEFRGEIPEEVREKIKKYIARE